MKRALIDRNMLDYRKYRSFIRTRSQAILEAVADRLGFSDQDFSLNNAEQE